MYISEPIIEFNNFTFKYYTQSEPTLFNINLKIYPGEKVLILGPSGSGKSTLAHCLNGLIPFAYKGDIEGSLKVKGFDTRDMDIFKLSKYVGTVLQDTDSQFIGLTVGEDIAFALENQNVPQDIMRKRVEEVARMVGMENFLKFSPFELSGGQKQRTTLAGVLVDDVDILLFDEPLANLDPATGKKAIEIIDEIHQNTNKTIIIIEHRIEDVLHRPIDRIIVIHEGRIIAELDPHQLMGSSILSNVGIREPLYISALKYSSVKVSEDMLPGYIWSLKLNSSEKKKVYDWYYLNIDKSGNKDLGKEVYPLLKVKNLSFSYEKKKH
ncbi:Energy-coupling factor transporter ATP-binding protein EcfA2 [Thermoanaerobacterium sp. RBIITD]|nr:DUF3744 domain-containing protein [Thermoanaerobacterium sp. RBIITD]SNX52757.1 Energy-coupling factor transporter ATP-binding protein EcfA2 [Thermoanaerobacterium sp. RBIITD]